MTARKKTKMKKAVSGRLAGRPTSPLCGYRYPLVVAAIAVPLFALYTYPYAENGAAAAAIQSYLDGYARMVGAILSLLDARVTLSGNRIVGPTFAMSIVKTCDAMEVIILLAAALAGFPMPAMRRLVATVLAVASLFSVNVFRLCVLYGVGVYAPAWFDRIHEVVAPLFMVVCALAIFLIATTRRRGAPPLDTAVTDVAPC